MEYNIGKEAKDVFSKERRYLPRLDIAIGPFSISHDRKRHTTEICHAAECDLIHVVAETARYQNGSFSPNPNPRCLLAIEIEFSGSSKLIMGDFTNASMMGYAGVIIGPSKKPNMQAKVRGVAHYIKTLRTLGKAPDRLFTNVAYFNDKDFLHQLRKWAPR